MKKIVLFCLLFLAVMACAGAAQSRETLFLAAADIQSLRIECGAGDLKVRGEEKLDRIEVDATLHVRGISESELPEFKKEYVKLKLEKNGSQARLTAEIESHFSLESLFGGHEAYIDLQVRLPRRLALAVEDGSGDIEIKDAGGDVDVEDGSGEIRLVNVTGSVTIDDGSGDMVLAGLGGRIEIEDGSGDIELKDAGGDVDVDDGSGEIRLVHVSGSVTIDDGSGDIVIDGVEKDLTIEEAGSGDVSIHNVKGKVRK